MTHNHIEGTPIGQHPLVSRFLNRIYNSWPRSQDTWNVDIVVRFIQAMGDNEAETAEAVMAETGFTNGLSNCNF